MSWKSVKNRTSRYQTRVLINSDRQFCLSVHTKSRNGVFHTSIVIQFSALCVLQVRFPTLDAVLAAYETKIS